MAQMPRTILQLPMRLFACVVEKVTVCLEVESNCKRLQLITGKATLADLEEQYGPLPKTFLCPKHFEQSPPTTVFTITFRIRTT
jgi:hypothetical protein